MAGDPEIAMPRLFEVLVAHRSRQATMPVVPTAMIPAAYPLRGDVGSGDQRWPVETAATVPPQPQEQLVVLGAGGSTECLDVRRERPDRSEDLSPEGDVRADEAEAVGGIPVERIVPVVQERQGTPVLPGEPGGPGHGPVGQYPPPDAGGFRVLREGRENRRGPLSRDPKLII